MKAKKETKKQEESLVLKRPSKPIPKLRRCKRVVPKRLSLLDKLKIFFTRVLHILKK